MYRFLINLLLVLIPYCCLSQVNDPGFIQTKIDTITNEFYYDYYYKKDSTDFSSELYQEMVLRIGKKYSKFAAVNKILQDSLVFEYKDLELGTAVMKIASQIQKNPTGFLCNYYIFKNYPKKGEINFIGDLGSKTTLSVKEKTNLNWEHIAGDTTILSFSCQKAICSFSGRKYIAWFTPEIPISDGPYKFCGLPGLILRIADTHNEHIFELFKVKPIKSLRPMYFIKDHDLTETTPEHYRKALTLFIKNLYLKWGGNPNLQFSNLDGEAKMLHNIRTTNNFIEKY